MNLKDLKGSYDAIYSLGHNCLAGIQLRNNNLRPFAGVLDWVGSPSLPDVTRLLQNQFAGFLEKPNLEFRGYATDKDLLVSDNAYKIYFNHDFKTNVNTPTNLAAYPEVKQKYDRRVARFKDKMANGRSLLFIRTQGTLEEIAELEKVLSRVVKHDFRILVVNHTKVKGIVERNWPLQRVCVVELPDTGFGTGDMFHVNDALWKTLLSGINVTV
ncbi:DUF1796 family putative cysteine peptidase [Peribacillus simplex]|uniref:DUF1796 family putative cysteine peptidase n=2 Tax=Peribacillus TaxID=2675229 RepID=A0AA90PJT1_9BACI|nr:MULTISPECIES: DUF1796 family putative cysteine peptidase [Peribacillus]MDP1419257.1 DUF1796 family putative cysteine peptidase [Peribacillus simplex]MDP1452105.1 DUF1796 family putative cysteine peptidase [Peribacillus frigoritolerans]